MNFFRLINIYFTTILLFASSVFSQTVENIELNLIPQKSPFNLQTQIPKEFENFTLVLSGGGARAISQIGTLKFLIEENIPFTKIFGTSMGAIIGGMLSSGYSIQQIDSILTSVDWDLFFSPDETTRNQLFLEQKRFLDNSILTLQLDSLQELIPNSISSGLISSNFFTEIELNSPLNCVHNFSKYLYNFSAVSTNLLTGKTEILNKGNLGKALRASSSVTFLMPPVNYDSLLLIDGGISANIPVRVAKENGADFIIALDSSSPLRKKGELVFPWEYADQIVSIPMMEINALNLTLANFVIQPIDENQKSNDFSNLDSLVDVAYNKKRIVKDLEKRIINFLENTDSSFSRIYKVSFKNIDSNTQSFLTQINETEVYSKAELYYHLFKKYKKENRLFNLRLEKNSEESWTANLLNVTADKPIKINVFINDLRKSTFFCKNINDENLQSIIIKELNRFRADGNILAQYEYLNRNEEQIEIHFKSTEIDSVRINGLKTTNKFVVRRELDFTKNMLSSKSLKNSLENLRTTNLFESINLSLAKKDNCNLIDIDVSEKANRLLRLGLKIDNENFTQAFLSIRNENLLGSGNQLGFIFLGGLRSQKFAFEHTSPRIFETYLTYKLKLYINNILYNYYQSKDIQNQNKFVREKVGEYWQRDFGFNLSFGAQIQKSGVIYAEYYFSNNSIIEEEGISPKGESNQIGALRLTFNVDSRNSFPYPTQGVFLKTYFETSFSSIGSRINYNKIFINYKSVYGFGKRTVVEQAFQLGYGDPSLPLTEQFHLGGQYSFFGLSKYDTQGRQLILSSTNFRYKLPVKIFFDSYLSFRYDLGNLWENAENILFNNLRHGFGLSFSLDTPIGPADFSMGKSFLISNENQAIILKTSPLHFYFTIGYYFDF